MFDIVTWSLWFKSKTHNIVQVACALYNFFQGYNLLICNELFVVGWLTISVVLREFIIGINIVFKKVFSWPIGNKMQTIMQGFKSFCVLLNIQGIIDGMHYSISKFVGSFNEDYFYHITCDDNIMCQAIANDKKMFTDLFIGFLESVNDLRVLRKLGFMLMLNNKDYLMQIKVKMVLLLTC